MLKNIFFILIMVCSSSHLWAQEKGGLFDPDINYDVYFSSQGGPSFVMRRIKIISQNMDFNNPYIIVRTDRSMGKLNGYIFMNNVHAIVPSDYFQVDAFPTGSRK